MIKSKFSHNIFFTQILQCQKPNGIFNEQALYVLFNEKINTSLYDMRKKTNYTKKRFFFDPVNHNVYNSDISHNGR